MPLNLDYQFFYSNEPEIDVTVSTPATDSSTLIFALIDTGAEVSLLDTKVATQLGIDLESVPPTQVTGISGDVIEARRALVTLQLLSEPDLEITTLVAFIPGIEDLLGNLIGLDVLSHFDFGLSHANRVGYLGRAEV